MNLDIKVKVLINSDSHVIKSINRHDGIADKDIARYGY
jgi:hypothetical protein